MKKVLLYLLFLSVTHISIAQKTVTNVEKQFLEYSQFILDKNLDKALDYTNP